MLLKPMLLNQVEINRFKVKASNILLESDPVVVEEPLQISLSQNKVDGANNTVATTSTESTTGTDSTTSAEEVYSLTMRTPGNDKELTYGLLFSEGVINKASDIQSIQSGTSEENVIANLLTVQISPEISLNLNDKRRRHASYSGCGLCGKTSLQALELKQSRNFKRIKSKLDNKLVKSLKALLAQQPLFSQTGGSHVAGLIYEQSGQLNLKSSPFFEDVGRHNALDKLIGYELLENDLQQSGILVLSGRIGFELVQKSVMAGFPVIIALGAPSNLAIQAANQFDITLIGFAKDNSFNLYTADKELLG